MAAPREYAAAVIARAFPRAQRPGEVVSLDALRGLRLDQHVDLEEVLRLVVDDVVAHLGADRGTIYLVDHKTDELVSHIAHLPELDEIRLRVGEGVAGWVARHGQPVNVVPGVPDARFAPRIDASTGYHTLSQLVAPVHDEKGTLVGVVQILNKRSGAFTGDDAAQLAALCEQIAGVLAETSLRSQLRQDAEHPLGFFFNHIVGDSPPMREVFRRTLRAAQTNATVLVRGESGAGKEAISRAVHANSPRRAAPFVKVDCAALPAQLIENELFGHERGAFTGADKAADGQIKAADGGTLFLDEVGELPLAVQGKLLRLLQERTFLRVGGTRPIEVDVRFVCATHRDLEADVAAGSFRKDLYYRLRVVQIDVPALRERGQEDLDRLVDHFFFEATRRYDRPNLTLSRGAREAIRAHDWPGNVRELEHCIESAVVLASGPAVDRGALPIVASPAPAPDGAFRTDIQPLRVVERAYIEYVLDHFDGNRSAAARALEIGRNTLLRKLKD